ncbi:hypothetical protein [Zavarzinia aquatilis]|nr:hypothetical protein [Zavarzinia aquatilis]
MPEWLQSWWPAIILGTPLALGSITWAIRKGLASQKDLQAAEDKATTSIAAEGKQRDQDYRHIQGRLNEIDRRLDRGEDRFERIGLRLDQLPNKDDINRIALGMAEVNAAVGKLGVRVEGLSDRLGQTDERLQTLDDYLRQDSLIEKQKGT